MSKIKIETIKASDETLLALLCSAFEGGSNYWASPQEFDPPEGRTRKAIESACGDFETWYTLAAVAGGVVYVVDRTEGSTHPLTREGLERGLVVMADKYARHFGDLLSENYYGITADVFLQCALFGEVLYG